MSHKVSVYVSTGFSSQNSLIKILQSPRRTNLILIVISPVSLETTTDPWPWPKLRPPSCGLYVWSIQRSVSAKSRCRWTEWRVMIVTMQTRMSPTQRTNLLQFLTFYLLRRSRATHLALTPVLTIPLLRVETVAVEESLDDSSNFTGGFCAWHGDFVKP
jgi:hypothetical protein